MALAVVASLGTYSAMACPWCATNAVMKPTVTAEMPDPGGTYFGKTPDPTRVRHYFVTAEASPWEYFDDRDSSTSNLPPAHLRGTAAGGKLRYIQYLDAACTQPALAREHLGLLGPVLRGVVGDFLVVTFVNRTDRPLSMHPHGVRYDKDSEGASYFPGRGLGAAIAPGARFTYVWELDPQSGPRPDEPSSKAWLYHSHVLGEAEINAGLTGFLIVTDPKRARPDGTPADVDREFGTLFLNYDESGLPMGSGGGEASEASSIDTGATPQLRQEASAEASAESRQHERGARHALNGRSFASLRGLDMVMGERIRWHVFALGSEDSLHTAHWHGVRVSEDGRRNTDVIELLPASMKTADFIADNPGTWLFHCHVGEHMHEGMYAQYRIHPVGTSLPEPAWFAAADHADRARIRTVRRVAATNGLPTRLELSGLLPTPARVSLVGAKVLIQLGTHTETLALDQRGSGGHRDGTGWVEFRVAATPGYFNEAWGGRLEFKLELGSAWEEGLKDSKVGSLVLTLGEAQHTLTFPRTESDR